LLQLLQILSTCISFLFRLISAESRLEQYLTANLANYFHLKFEKMQRLAYLFIFVVSYQPSLVRLKQRSYWLKQQLLDGSLNRSDPAESIVFLLIGLTFSRFRSQTGKIHARYITESSRLFFSYSFIFNLFIQKVSSSNQAN
jgi:hypothetical protein